MYKRQAEELIGSYQELLTRVTGLISAMLPKVVGYGMEMCIRDRPCTLHQFAVFKLIDYIGEETAVFTIQPLESLGVKVVITVVATVSYTHLDVYKRQDHFRVTGRGELFHA